MGEETILAFQPSQVFSDCRFSQDLTASRRETSGKNPLAEPSQFTKPWHRIINYFFKAQSFRLVYYTAINNWVTTFDRHEHN